MDLSQDYATWTEVDLSAIEDNIRYFSGLSQADVMAVVKANAYGHGSIEVARAALRSGAAWLAVARVEEAREIREAGIDGPVLLLGYTPGNRLPEMIDLGITLTLWNLDQAIWVGDVAAKQGQTAVVHLKVDTGMSRLGARPIEVQDLVTAIGNIPGVHLGGIFTHLARADEKEADTTDHQVKRFIDLLEDLEKNGKRPPLAHCANSAAALKRLGSHLNLIRVGIAIYGMAPSSETPLPKVLRPALSWKSSLAQVKTLPAGRGVSYGHQYITSREERIGTIPVGYADGFRRVDGNQVLVRGRAVPVIGRVTMDQIMVNLDSLPDARAGDEVVILGKQGKERISAEDIAERWGTINYEVTSGIAARVPRIYV